MKAIKLENVGKRFILTFQKDRAIRGFFSSSKKKFATEFWALKGINMEVEKGKVVGIIGRNGAGKTTLLNILGGISSPTMGKIQVNGRISSLLTLGAGFQDELTGEENIYLNSSILGMGRNEINKKYRSIVEFSELDGFLDSPLQTYSQGMRLRLGFSISIHMDFDILLIDEILSVGDVAFQKKSFDRIEEFKKQGKTMVITTQSLDVIERFCDEAFLFENGKIAQHGYPQKVAAHYLELLNKKKFSETFQQRYGKLRWWADRRFWEKKEGSKEARIVEVKTYNAQGKQTNQFKTGEKITFKARFVVKEQISEPHFGVAIFREEDGVYCYGPNTFFDGHRIDELNKGEGFFSIEYKSLHLKPGRYRFSAAIWDKNEFWPYDYHVGFYKFEIIGKNNNLQLLNLRYRWKPEYWWQKFKTAQLKEPDSLFNLNVRWKNKVSSDVQISSIELLDSSDNPKRIFHTGDDLKIKLQFKFLKKPQDYQLWLGLFRNDDVYCHGLSRELGEEVIFLIYPNFPLLAGDYYLSLGIWRKDQQEPLLYKHKASIFKMSFLGQDHGTVYLEHSWKLELP